MTVTLDSNLLLSALQARSGSLGSGSVLPQSLRAAAAKIPVAPWDSKAQPAASALVRDALSGKEFFNERSIKLSVKGADPDYAKLFAINQGLLALQALARAADAPNVLNFNEINAAFNRGLAELSSYIENTRFSNLRLSEGAATASGTTISGVPKKSDSYTTAPIAADSADAAAAAFAGAVQFDIQVTNKLTKIAKTVHIDLAGLGATTRSIRNVAKYINDQLVAAGSGVRVGINETKIPARTITVNGKSTTISEARSDFGLQFTGLLGEDIKFSAATTSPAIFIAQSAGDPDPDDDATTSDGVQQQELLKFEGGSAPDATAARPGDQNWVAGRVFSQKLPEGVGAVRATATGADGSVYLLADATGTVAGQTIKGDQDVVLLKYDAAGQLAYARTLGAGSTATGFSLAVSSTGKVAVAGSVTGGLGGDAGIDPAISDSFVTEFDANGDELWTRRQRDIGTDEAQALAFDASGRLFVAGRTQNAFGTFDGYLRAFDSAGNVLSQRTFGSAGNDKVSGLVVNGTDVIVAGQDGSHGVLRRFDFSDPGSPILVASRDLGSLGGGVISGIGLDGAGNILIGGSAAADLNIGTTTLARGGGVDAFGARISADLSTTNDAIAYYGGSGDDQATAATVAGGQVWLTGTSNAALPGGLNPVGTQDGFIAALDVTAGNVAYANRFTAKDRFAAPQSIAVNLNGASVLDRLGLPTGSIAEDKSTLLTSSTSLRAGDQFRIRARGVTTTITIDASETLSTLANKIRGAALSSINVSGTSELILKPTSDSDSFDLLAGALGRDALAALGLRPALVRNITTNKDGKVTSADTKEPAYGLHFSGRPSLDSKADIKAAVDELDNAITAVRAAFSELRTAQLPKDPLAEARRRRGPVPAHLQARIANFQAGLDRLLAGGG